MTYGVVVDLAAPVEMYDTLHQELLRTLEGPVEGLLVHVGRATPSGFQVIEVWESRELYDRYHREVVWPLAARLWGELPPSAPAPTEESFDVRGFIVGPALVSAT